MDEKGTKKNGSGRSKWNSENKERNEGGLTGRVVGRFRPCNPFNRSLSKLLGVFGDFSLDHIRGVSCNDGCRSGDKTYSKSNSRTSENGFDRFFKILESWIKIPKQR